MGAFSSLGECIFCPDLFPQILIPRNHATPYCDPQTGEDAPFVTVGPFASMDTLFHGTAGDLELYTAEEVVALRNAGVFKSSNTGPSTPILPSLTYLGQALPPPVNSKLPNHRFKVEPDSSTRKRDYRSSPRSHRCPVSTATGSHEDLDKSEHEHEAACKQLH